MGTQESLITPAELEPLVGRAITAVDRLGLDGRRLAVMGENSTATLVAHLGALSAGVSSVAVARYLTVDDVAYILADSGAGAVLSSEATAEVAAKAAAQVGALHLRSEDWLAPTPSPPAADQPARTL